MKLNALIVVFLSAISVLLLLSDYPIEYFSMEFSVMGRHDFSTNKNLTSLDHAAGDTRYLSISTNLTSVEHVEGDRLNLSVQLMEKLSTRCECETRKSCSKCGVRNCWNDSSNSISRNCFHLFATNTNYFVRKQLPSKKIKMSNNFNAVLDFDCDHRFHKAFFHALIDCFINQLILIEEMEQVLAGRNLTHAAANVAVVSSPHMLRYMELVCLTMENRGTMPAIFNPVSQVEWGLACLHKHHHSGAGLVLTQNYRFWFVSHNSKWMEGSAAVSVRITAKRLFTSLIREQYHIPGKNCSNVVLMPRSVSHNRRFLDQADLIDAFKSHFGPRNVLLYTGTENLVQTISIFRTACAVVGYHGAGAINILFAPPGTLCLEITTFRGHFNATSKAFTAARSWVPWRTNRALTDGLDYRWDLKLIELHHVWPLEPPGTTWTDPQLIIKNANIQLTREHIHDLVARVDGYLEARGVRLSYPRSVPGNVRHSYQVPKHRLGYA